MVIDKLRELINKHGQQILNDPNKFGSLMLDLCMGTNEREINILVTALMKKIPQQLQSSGNASLTDDLRSSLSQRLENATGLRSDAANWAVNTWAAALGIVIGQCPELVDTKESPPQQVYLVGIAGRPCSGKDASVQRIASVNKRVIHINADMFFKTKCTHLCNGYECLEHEQALRFDHMIDVISSLKNGDGTVIEDRTLWWGAYDCEINDSDLNDKTIIIVQGFLLFVRKDIYSLFDNRMFIKVSDNTMMERSLARRGEDAVGYIRDVIIPVSRDYESRQKDVAEKPFFDSDKDSAVHIADQIVSRINGEFSKNNIDNHIVSPMKSGTWEVEFGDILSDHEWHPIQFKNLRKWVKQQIENLDSGEVLSDEAFSFRRNYTSQTNYDVQLIHEWSKYRPIFRYTRAETPPKRDL